MHNNNTHSLSIAFAKLCVPYPIPSGLHLLPTLSSQEIYKVSTVISPIFYAELVGGRIKSVGGQTVIFYVNGMFEDRLPRCEGIMRVAGFTGMLQWEMRVELGIFLPAFFFSFSFFLGGVHFPSMYCKCKRGA